MRRYPCLVAPFVVAVTLLPAGCGLFEVLSSGPDFSVSGARVLLMPLGGPGESWYGENRTARYLHDLAASVLREGGAELCSSEKILRELADYTGDAPPPWVDYGKRLRADYVIVSRITEWQIEQRLAVGYTPGSAAMEIHVYDVSTGKLALQKPVEASVGTDPDSADIYADPETTRRALARLLMKKWASVFVGKSLED